MNEKEILFGLYVFNSLHIQILENIYYPHWSSWIMEFYISTDSHALNPNMKKVSGTLLKISDSNLQIKSVQSSKSNQFEIPPSLIDV